MSTFVIAINAISGGGKTTITKKLQERLTNSKALYFDDRNYDSDSGIDDTADWIENGADVNLWDLSRLANDVQMLLQENLDYIIMDYPFGYRQNQIAPYINYSIFIDTPLDIALARRILRDYNEDTAVTIFDDMKQYLGRGRNAYLYGIDTTKESADFLVDGALLVEEIVSRICDKVISRQK